MNVSSTPQEIIKSLEARTILIWLFKTLTFISSPALYDNNALIELFELLLLIYLKSDIKETFSFHR